MRRSGSSSCMLRPRASTLSLNGMDFSDQLSVTVINTQMLPTYSTERFYMLSEFELKGHSTKFLCDYDSTGIIADCDQTQDTVASTESLEIGTNGDFPSFIVLYLLWKPDTYHSAKSFAEGPLQESVDKLLDLIESSSDNKQTNPPPSSPSSRRKQAAQSSQTPPSSPQRSPIKEEGFSPPISPSQKEETDEANIEQGTKIYLVVDKVVPREETAESAIPGALQRRYQVQVDIAELLARQIAKSPKMRCTLDGITVGLTDHMAAAPGLEACMEALTLGASDRRLVPGDGKSCIGVVCDLPEELLGIQEGAVETDAIQGLLQSRSCAEWNGKGNILSFARRAHESWRKQNNIFESPPAETTRRRRRRIRRIKNVPDPNSNPRLDFAEQLSTWMVWIFLALVTQYLWKHYRSNLHDVLLKVLPLE